MMELVIKFDSSQLVSGLQRLKSFTPKCEERARRDAIKKGRTTFTGKNGAPSIYNVKKKELEEYTRTSDEGIEVESRLFTIGSSTHFAITPRSYTSQKGIPVSKRKKATNTIIKGNKERMPHAFIINPSRVGNTMLWGRPIATKGENAGLEVLTPITSLSAAQMLSNKTISEKVMDEMNKTFEKRFEHYFEREEEKIAKH